MYLAVTPIIHHARKSRKVHQRVFMVSQLHGDQSVFATNCNYVILRTAWLYSEFGKNFVKTMTNLTATKPQFKVVFNQVETPTYALDLTTAIAAILDDYNKECSTYNYQWSLYAKRGVYYYSNDGVTS